MSDKIKKFSQAIRLGCTISRQTAGAMVRTNGATCALGAGILGVAMAKTDFKANDATDIISAVYVEISLMSPTLSKYGITGGIVDEIVKRNDTDGQTREQIADWLEAQGL